MMVKQIPDGELSEPREGWTTYSALSAAGKANFLNEARNITGAVYPGLELNKEIEVMDKLAIGDTVILRDSDRSTGFAISHFGEGSEADCDVCYVKFAAVAPGPAASSNFKGLVSACASFACSKGANKLFGGVNTAREEAFDTLLSQGFKMEGISVAMHKPNEPGYSRSGIFVMDDWR
jgi:hypothetical protein